MAGFLLGTPVTSQARRVLTIGFEMKMWTAVRPVKSNSHSVSESTIVVTVVSFSVIIALAMR